MITEGSRWSREVPRLLRDPERPPLFDQGQQPLRAAHTTAFYTAARAEFTKPLFHSCPIREEPLMQPLFRSFLSRQRSKACFTAAELDDERKIGRVLEHLAKGQTHHR